MNIDSRSRDERAETVHGQQSQREQNAPTQVRDTENVGKGLEELHGYLAFLNIIVSQPAGRASVPMRARNPDACRVALRAVSGEERMGLRPTKGTEKHAGRNSRRTEGGMCAVFFKGAQQLSLQTPSARSILGPVERLD